MATAVSSEWVRLARCISERRRVRARPPRDGSVCRSDALRDTRRRRATTGTVVSEQLCKHHATSIPPCVRADDVRYVSGSAPGLDRPHCRAGLPMAHPIVGRHQVRAVHHALE